MKVDLIDRMGTDLDVVNAARVSFDKESDWIYQECSCSAHHESECCCGAWSGAGDKLRQADRKLIKYLATHNHWSPFSHCYLKFRIKAPIFVARQLQKHVVGLAWNEVSRRYVDFTPEFHEPKGWRKRADNVKQGSSEETLETVQVWGSTKRVTLGIDTEYQRLLEEAVGLYEDLLDQGVCPEQARMVLPQSMMTEWIWSGSLYAFARVCKLRLDSHAQAETREVAQGIYTHMKNLFPVSTEALIG